MDNQETSEQKAQTAKVDDLPADDAQQDEVKGGSGNTVWTGDIRSS